MADIIEMPKLSDTMTVGTLVKWLRQEGDAVKSGDMLAEIETDKATMELESFFSGTLLKLFALPGAQVAIGADLKGAEVCGMVTSADLTAALSGLSTASGPGFQIKQATQTGAGKPDLDSNCDGVADAWSVALSFKTVPALLTKWVP